jgi:DNA-directed RNA polymerase beta subunit
MTSKITMVKHLNLGVNANIISMVKKGDHVKTGEPLAVFEQSFDDSDANKLLDSLGDEFEDAIQQMGRNEFKSKYTGEIVDIKIYYNRDIDEFLPSVQKIIKAYNKEIEERKSIVSKTTNTGFVFPPNTKSSITKFKNEEIDGIYIEFYIRYEDKLSIGDKITFSTALKTIVSTVTPKGEEPYSEYRKDENINAVLSPLSVVSRMTTDFFNILYLNKVLIELKRHVKDIYEGK